MLNVLHRFACNWTPWVCISVKQHETTSTTGKAWHRLRSELHGKGDQLECHHSVLASGRAGVILYCCVLYCPKPGNRQMRHQQLRHGGGSAIENTCIMSYHVDM